MSAAQDKPHKLVPGAVTRLAMIDVTWAHWGVTLGTPEAQQSWFRHQELLTTLLGGRLSHGCGGSGSGDLRAQPGAQIALELNELEEHESDLKEKTELQRDLVNLDPLLLRPQKWFEGKKKEFGKQDAVIFGKCFETDHADRVVRFIADGLKECELTANRAELRRAPELLAAQMNLFGCRIYLTPERAAGLIHGPPGKQLADPGHVMIDLRFREHLGRYWLYATFVVSTHPFPVTTGGSFWPTGGQQDGGPLADGLTVLRARYANALRRGFQDHVHAFFPPVRMTIRDRQCRPPRFWVVSGQELIPAGVASWNGQLAGQRALFDALLGVRHPDTTGLGAGDINGRVHVFRRFISSSRRAHDQPVYLTVPFSSAVDGKDDDLWSLIQKLSDLAADVVARLFGIVADIDIYRSQLKLYEKIAAQGLALWDQLALFLPVTKGAQLGKTHRLIELIHQILLQGIADLEDEAANAEHTLERIQAVADDLIDQFDREFTERPVPGHVTIRDSLVEAGYFGKARRAAHSVHEQSRQVRATFKALLESMTYAFDERRVRETDALQWVALLFAIVLGFASSWNEFLARGIANWTAVGPWVGFGGAGIVLVIGVVLVMRSYRSRLTSSRFNGHFKVLQTLLAAYSSDRLDRLREEDEQNALGVLACDGKNSTDRIVITEQVKVLEKDAQNWRTLDEKLAEEVAALLDALPKPPRREQDWMTSLPEANLADLHERVEVWALRALLVTERPRRFCRVPLPRLTFLYRFFPILSGTPSKGLDWFSAENQVSDHDFRLTVENHCGGEAEYVPLLMRWGRQQVRDLHNTSGPERRPPEIGLFWRGGLVADPSIASRFVKRLQEVGLDGHMANERFQEMMEKMNQSAWDKAEFKDWQEAAVGNLEDAKFFKSNARYEKACVTAKGSAELQLTGLLRGAGADVPDDYDVVRLGVETRKTIGPLPLDVQDAIWRLSAYQEPRGQLGIHRAGRADARVYVESDATTALDAAKLVLMYVDGYVQQWEAGAPGSPGPGTGSDIWG